MLVNDECSPWYNRVGDFQYQFGIGEDSFCTSMDQHAWPDRTTPLRSMWSIALSAMTVECEQFINLFCIALCTSMYRKKKLSDASCDNVQTVVHGHVMCLSFVHTNPFLRKYRFLATKWDLPFKPLPYADTWSLSSYLSKGCRMQIIPCGDDYQQGSLRDSEHTSSFVNVVLIIS